MSEEYKHPMMRIGIAMISIMMLVTIWFYVSGYSTSLDWSLSTEPMFEEVVAHKFQKGPFQFSILGEKVTLLESFYLILSELKTL